MGLLNGVILSVVDEKGPHPLGWYPNFASLTQIHNSAVKSFAILIGDKIYRKKTPQELVCFGILPFPDIKSIGFIHFFGMEDSRNPKYMKGEIPTTVTLFFPESYRDEVYKKATRLHQFLERETKELGAADSSTPKILSKLYEKVEKFLETL